MRIAFTAYRGSMSSGGQGIYLHALTRELAALGHEIDVYVGPPYPDPLPWVSRVIRLDDLHFWASRFYKHPGAFLPDRDRWRVLAPLHFFELAVTRFGFFPEPFAFSLRAARAIRTALLAGRRYDLVHDVQTLGYGLLWLRALGLPVVSTIHHPLTVDLRSSLARARGFRELKGALTFHPVRTQARVARHIDAILTSSEVSRATIARDFGAEPARVHDVLNGVELPPAGVPRKRPGRPELLFVGRAGDPNKGLEFLLDALTRLPDPVRLRCLCDRPLRGDPIHDQIERLGLAGRVRFDGKVSREALEAAYRDAAVVLLPSLFEGFGLPAVEGLAAGTPVVATDAGALPEVLEHAGAGRRVPRADAPALAAAIDEVLGDWEGEQERVLAARPRIERAFGWAEVAARTAGVYRRVLEARAG